MSESNATASNTSQESTKKHRIQAAAFLGLVGGISALFGFSRTLNTAQKSKSKLIEQGGRQTVLLLDEGSVLALRALCWGSFYAILGTGVFCFGIWKLSGANNMKEFRVKMGSGLPRLTKNDNQESRTEFDGLTDLMKYLAAWGKE